MKPKPKLPRARVGCVRFNEALGSMHLTAPGSVVAHATDVVYYALVLPMPSLKSARTRAKWENLSKEEKVERLAAKITLVDSASDVARACLAVMGGA